MEYARHTVHFGKTNMRISDVLPTDSWDIQCSDDFANLELSIPRPALALAGDVPS